MNLNLTILNSNDNKNKNGGIIKGDLEDVGWVVIKSIIPNYMSTMIEIKDIAYCNNKWIHIGQKTKRHMKFTINYLPFQKWNNTAVTVFEIISNTGKQYHT